MSSRPPHLNETAKQVALDFIDVLQEKFPAIFTKKPNVKVPLAIGFVDQLIAIKDELGVSKAIIRNSLFLWCSGSRYKTAIANLGSARFNLDGSQAGIVINPKGIK